ncbi:MAG: hypothetical protein ACJ8DZ_13915 [Allosphingosinicella sp.]
MTEQTATTKREKPTPSEIARQPICTECGGPLPPRPEKAKGPPRLYCTVACKKARNARRLVRGSAVIEWAQAWRRNRAQGPLAQAAFAEMNTILDQFNAEDLQANRPPADLAAARMLMGPFERYFDRQRRSPERERKAAEKAAAPDLTALQAKVDDPETTDNERAILAAALEILTAKAA